MRTLIATLITLMQFAATPVVAEAEKEGLTTAQAQKGFRSFKPLAEQGNPLAQFFIGMLYTEGKGVPQDYAKAVHWYTKTAKQGNVKAQTALGEIYYMSKGVPEDYAKAAKQGLRRPSIIVVRCTPKAWASLMTMCAGMRGLALQLREGGLTAKKLKQLSPNT